ncbi:hypothetical protein [Stakelama marina]|uniref:Mlr4354 like protein n=1 Tax=Stakelama marina TaxID=2826939 RepID=A0A8T4IM37_9SPHN|nr:hypothetical protein [Stakelama marina]MBR0553226.1 hypothetical protein [Stakelama marina]
MTRRLLLAALSVAVAGPATAADSLGIFESWGAFRDDSPRHCYAIAQPVRPISARRAGAFASIATWPGQGIRDQINVHLSRNRNPDAKVTLSVGERRFELIAGDRDAWAPDAETDRAIVGAMRSGRSMSVESVSRSGRPFADIYLLKGAATAIDAAAVGCLARAPGR